MKKLRYITIAAFSMALLASCTEFLEEEPTKTSTVVPSTVEPFRKTS